MITIGRQKTSINKRFLEEHGGLEADLSAKNSELHKEVAIAKQINNQKMTERRQRHLAERQARREEEFVRRNGRLLSKKEQDLVMRTFHNCGKGITFQQIREAVFYNEEFREMFEELIESERLGEKVCSSDTAKWH